jgi:hypothetical protein
MSKHLTIFEVLDNYFGTENLPSPEKLNYGEIREIRKHILDFYEAFKFAPRSNFETRIFLGSFLSSPPWHVESAPYLASALLCADSVTLFDPLHYWFCDGQYERERLMSAPTGWRDARTRQPDYQQTKKYLTKSFNWYSQIRPLVDAGIVILIPAEDIIQRCSGQIQELEKGISQKLNPLWDHSNNFNPEEITVDDNQKGVFVFVGGDKNPQIEKHFKRGVLHFARDIAISNETRSLYTAPFRWEQFLGHNTLNGFIKSNEYSLTIESIRNSRLPILSNLTPETLVKIHKDSGYTNFRVGLGETFKNINEEINTPKFSERVSKIEQDILLPKIEAIQDEVKSSGFMKATNAVLEGVFTFAQTFLGNIPTGLDTEKNIIASSLTGSASLLRQIFTRATKSPDRRIWMELIPEKPTLELFGPHFTLQKTENSGWEIDDQSSMKVTISKGILKFEKQ